MTAMKTYVAATAYTLLAASFRYVAAVSGVHCVPSSVPGGYSGMNSPVNRYPVCTMRATKKSAAAQKALNTEHAVAHDICTYLSTQLRYAMRCDAMRCVCVLFDMELARIQWQNGAGFHEFR